MNRKQNVHRDVALTQTSRSGLLQVIFLILNRSSTTIITLQLLVRRSSVYEVIYRGIIVTVQTRFDQNLSQTETSLSIFDPLELSSTAPAVLTVPFTKTIRFVSLLPKNILELPTSHALIQNPVLILRLQHLFLNFVDDTHGNHEIMTIRTEVLAGSVEAATSWLGRVGRRDG